MKKLQNSTRRDPILIPTGRFLLPFFDAVLQEYVTVWYTRREKDAQLISDEASDFLQNRRENACISLKLWKKVKENCGKNRFRG